MSFGLRVASCGLLGCVSICFFEPLQFCCYVFGFLEFGFLFFILFLPGCASGCFFEPLRFKLKLKTYTSLRNIQNNNSGMPPCGNRKKASCHHCPSVSSGIFISKFAIMRAKAVRKPQIMQ